MSNAQFGWDDATAFEASMAKYHADKATAAVETYGEFIATISTAEEAVKETAKPVTAMTPAEQVAISEARATVENIQWEAINAAAIVAMNAHKPSANLVALRKYLTK